MRDDSKLLQGHRCAGRVGVPVLLSGRRKRGERQMIMSHVERRMRLHELHRRPDGLADRARFGTQIVFEASNQPESWLFLKHHQPQSLRCHGCHAPLSGNLGDRLTSPASGTKRCTYDRDDSSAVAIHDEEITRCPQTSSVASRTSASPCAHDLVRTEQEM